MNSTNHDTVIGLVRTWVPIGVGAVFGWLATNGLEVDPETQAASIIAITGLIQALYYGIARLLESRYPALGWLLGSAHTPTYSPVEPEIRYIEVEVPAKKAAPKKKAAASKTTPAKKTAGKKTAATAKKSASKK